MSLFNEVFNEVKSRFDSARGSHGWDHTLRVYNLCLHIGEKENADLEVLRYAAILHDIAREEQDKSEGAICHAEKGAVLAKDILQKHNLEEDKIDKIIHCIETHRYRNNKIPESKEAKILFDSDKLDSIGAVGIGRAFLYSGEVGAILHNKVPDLSKEAEFGKEDTAYREFVVKLNKIKDKMFTQEGRRLAEQRHNYMVDFFNRLNKEVDGEL